jgi:hypothetical protein
MKHQDEENIEQNYYFWPRKASWFLETQEKERLGRKSRKKGHF